MGLSLARRSWSRTFDISIHSLLSDLLKSGELAAEQLREAKPAFSHDGLVVPQEKRPRQRGDNVHPGFVRPDRPRVFDRRLSRLRELPAAGTFEVARGRELDEPGLLEPRHPGVEGEAVWQLRLPHRAVYPTEPTRVSRFEPGDAEYVRPPLGIALRGVDRLPDTVDRSVEPPDGDQKERRGAALEGLHR